MKPRGDLLYEIVLFVCIVDFSVDNRIVDFGLLRGLILEGKWEGSKIHFCRIWVWWMFSRRLHLQRWLHYSRVLTFIWKLIWFLKGWEKVKSVIDIDLCSLFYKNLTKYKKCDYFFLKSLKELQIWNWKQIHSKIKEIKIWQSNGDCQMFEIKYSNCSDILSDCW
jgi:hypothetical protein